MRPVVCLVLAAAGSAVNRAKFKRLLVEKVKKIVIGDPRDSKTLMAADHKPQYESTLAAIKQAASDGCKVLCGGGRLKLPESWPADSGAAHNPGRCGARHESYDEEILAPCSACFRSSMSARQSRSPTAFNMGFRLSLDGEWSRALRMVKTLDTGIIWVNTMLTGYPEIPCHLTR